MPTRWQRSCPGSRADLAVATSCYQPWTESDRLDVPVIAYEGSADESASPGDAAAWARWTRREFTRHTVTGGRRWSRIRWALGCRWQSPAICWGISADEAAAMSRIADRL